MVLNIEHNTKHAACATQVERQVEKTAYPHHFFVSFCYLIHTASAPITSGTHTDGGAVIRKPGSAWLEGTTTIHVTCLLCNVVFFSFWFWIHTASAPITAGTLADVVAVIRKPISTWLEGTCPLIVSVCCFVLLNQYWGIVTVPGFHRVNWPQILTRGLPDLHPPPELRRWLYRSPPLPLRTDLATKSVDNQEQALAAPCLGRSKVHSASYFDIGEGPQ